MDPLRGLTLVLGFDNAFGASYRVHPSQLPQPGRSARVSLLYRFGLR